MAFVQCLVAERLGACSRKKHGVVCALPDKMAECARDLSSLPLMARYARLAEMGAQHSSSVDQEQLCKRQYRVPGCTSVVHVRVDLDDDGNVEIRGCSDAKLTAGLISLLMNGLEGCRKEDVLAMEFSEFAEATSLTSFMAASRANSFGNVFKSIREQLQDMNTDKNSPVNTVPSSLQYLTEPQGEDVAVLLSGGVDSSVALRLLMEEGYRPKPFYLKIWLEDELAHLGQCPWEEDLDYAKAVCDQVGLEVESVSLQKEYWDSVVEYTVDEAKAGRTPNPDVMCNSRVKFGVFLDRFGKDFPKVASGHYAMSRRNEQTGKVELVCSTDDFKDQTYFLAHLKQSQVENAVFPIGSYTKGRVRELAEGFNLPNKARKDSQGICFLGRLKFDDFLEHHLGRQPGSFVEYETGVELGQHRGYWFYTLGQRKGLGLSHGPWYVVSKNAEANIVYISSRYNDPDKPRNSFGIENLTWISGQYPSEAECQQLRVKVRHGPRSHNCILHLDQSGESTVILEETDRIGLAPGQFVAFYIGDVCLGSGVIANDPGLEHAPKEILGTTSKRLQAHYL